MRITLRNLEEVEHCVEGVWGPSRARDLGAEENNPTPILGTWHLVVWTSFLGPGSLVSWPLLSSRLMSPPHPGPSNATICHLGVSALQRDRPPILPSAPQLCTPLHGV